MSQTDDELWTLAEAYDKLTEMMKEQTKLKREIRDKILKKLAGKDGNYHAKYRGNRRVIAGSNTSYDISVKDMRDKFGEEFIEKHVIEDQKVLSAKSTRCYIKEYLIELLWNVFRVEIL